jgi:hypothetical protein
MLARSRLPALRNLNERFHALIMCPSRPQHPRETP